MALGGLLRELSLQTSVFVASHQLMITPYTLELYKGNPIWDFLGEKTSLCIWLYGYIINPII